MNSSLIDLLRKLNQPHDWNELLPSFKPQVASSFNQEPVYYFPYTFNHSLEISPHSIAISVQPVNSYIPFHFHNYVELMIPLVGDCTVWVKSEKIHVAQNDILIIGNRTIHRVESISSKTVVVNLTLKNNAFSLNDFDFIHKWKNTQSISNLLFSLLANENLGDDNYSLFQTKQDPKIIQTIYDILEEYYHPDPQSNQIIRLEILTLFSRLIRATSQNNTFVQTSKKNSPTILSLLLYIEKNYATVTLEQMANDFNFNPNYLTSYLKKNTGYPFIKLVQIQRVNVAAEFLVYTNAPIEQISAKVGYENPSYFYKIFRKHLGISPSEYREMNRQ